MEKVFQLYPERFVKASPVVKKPAEAVWINKPEELAVLAKSDRKMLLNLKYFVSFLLTNSATIEEAYLSVFYYIEHYYNSIRLLSYIGQIVSGLLKF